MEAEHVLNDEDQVRPVQKGEIAPDFVSSRTDGSQLALSDLKGNYVLLSFWAGWSRLSRDENQHPEEGTWKLMGITISGFCRSLWMTRRNLDRSH